MESLLKDFNVDPKRPSEEALRRWRKAVTIVKNRRRRFRMVADLAKRSEAEKKRRSIQVCSWQSHSQHSPRFCLRHALNSYFLKKKLWSAIVVVWLTSARLDF